MFIPGLFGGATAIGGVVRVFFASDAFDGGGIVLWRGGGLFDGDEDVFLGAHAELLGIVDDVGGVTGCHAFLEVDFAVVGGCLDGVDAGAVDGNGVE